MEGLSAEDIDAAGLSDWRKLAQALHGRWATDDLSAAAAFLAECDDSASHILEVATSLLVDRTSALPRTTDSGS